MEKENISLSDDNKMPNIEKIEQEVINRVYKKLKHISIIVAFILTGGGIISFSSIKNNLIQSASLELQNDKQLKAEIIENVESSIVEVKLLKEKVNNLSNEIEEERILAHQILRNDLTEVKLMLETIKSKVITNED